MAADASAIRIVPMPAIDGCWPDADRLSEIARRCDSCAVKKPAPQSADVSATGQNQVVSLKETNATKTKSRLFALRFIRLLASPCLRTRASADEGMWLYNQFPKQLLKDKYGFEPSDEWLKHVQLSSVRFNSGGSGSFVSSDGLVMTNHHVGADALAKAEHRTTRPGQDRLSRQDRRPKR